MFYFICYLIRQFVHVYSRNVLVDDYQVLVKWITKHLLSINGSKDWKKKSYCWQDREQNSILNSHLESSQIWVASLCMYGECGVGYNGEIPTTNSAE